MSNNELPNLSTWHRVPVGATIPAGTPYAYAYEDGLNVELGGYNCDITVGRGGGSYYTEHPITLPLPTEEGATIMVSVEEWPPHTLLTRTDGRWVNRFGDEWPVERVASWAPVTIGETVVVARGEVTR